MQDADLWNNTDQDQRIPGHSGWSCYMHEEVGKCCREEILQGSEAGTSTPERAQLDKGLQQL